MAGMRIPGRHLAIAAAISLSAAFLLTGCTIGGPEAGPAPTSASPGEESPTPEPSESPSVTNPGLTVVAHEAGDCAVDPTEFGVVTFVVTSDDSTTPIDLTYSAFQEGADADPIVRTVSVVGPVVTVMQTNCGNPAASVPWTFTATSPTENSLACTMFFGGKTVKADMDYVEGEARDASVDCTGHPGM